MESFIDINSEGFTQEEYLDIKLCLETLLSIQAGTQPLDRELGIDYTSVVGYPLNIAENMLSLEIIEKILKYEPRVEATSVTYEASTDGQLVPHVHIKKAGI